MAELVVMAVFACAVIYWWFRIRPKIMRALNRLGEPGIGEADEYKPGGTD